MAIQLALENTHNLQNTLAVQKNNKIESVDLKNREEKNKSSIFNSIERLIHHNEIAQLNAVILANGPGSFNGIRIGYAICSALKILYDFKIYSVSSALNLAYQQHSISQHKRIAVIQYAGLNQIYFSGYFFNLEHFEPLVSPQLMSMQADLINELIEQWQIEQITSDVNDFQLEKMQHNDFNLYFESICTLEHQLISNAKTLLEIYNKKDYFKNHITYQAPDYIKKNLFKIPSKK